VYVQVLLLQVTLAFHLILGFWEPFNNNDLAQGASIPVWCALVELLCLALEGSF